MKCSVAELSGSALDWAVAKLEGWEIKKPPSVWFGDSDWYEQCVGDEVRRKEYFLLAFSYNWQLAGPILQREHIWISDDGCGNWLASMNGPRVPSSFNYLIGETPLIAAMRCYVAAKMGDEIEVPDQIMEQQK